jgi:tetratricopeptide (TPR) repeat protein
MVHPFGRYFMLLLIAGFSTGLLEPKSPQTPVDQEEFLDAEDWFQSGLALNGAGNYRDASEAFARSISIEPGNAVAWLNLGTSRALFGDYNAAIDALRKAVRLDPHLALGFANLAEVCFRAERYREAVEAYTGLIALWPDDPNAHFKRGLAYLLLNEPGKAQAEYLTLKIVDPALAGKLLQVINQGSTQN